LRNQGYARNDRELLGALARGDRARGAGGWRIQRPVLQDAHGLRPCVRVRSSQVALRPLYARGHQGAHPDDGPRAGGEGLHPRGRDEPRTRATARSIAGPRRFPASRRPRDRRIPKGWHERREDNRSHQDLRCGMNNDLKELFTGAVDAGVLTEETRAMLTGHLGKVVIAGAAGTAAENIMASGGALVTVLIDSSSSIHARKLEQAVRDGQNLLIDAFAGAITKDSILMALWTFNDDVRVVHAYVPICDAMRLDKKNYAGVGCTKLYDTWCDAL